MVTSESGQQILVTTKLVVSGQYDGSGSDGVGLEFNTNAEKSSIESYVRPGAGAGDNEGVVGAKPYVHGI